MRLWSLHPKYLDPAGLVAAWREALLAQAVLTGRTRGYRYHPQLTRFQDHPAPRAAIARYLRGLLEEADRRGYRFDRRKIIARGTATPLPVTSGQLRGEWQHLLGKLRRRNGPWWRAIRAVKRPRTHPLFRLVPGRAADWERARPERAS
jgi:hypothetical protein